MPQRKTYTFEELDDRAQGRARDTYLEDRYVNSTEWAYELTLKLAEMLYGDYDIEIKEKFRYGRRRLQLQWDTNPLDLTYECVFHFNNWFALQPYEFCPLITKMYENNWLLHKKYEGRPPYSNGQMSSSNDHAEHIISEIESDLLDEYAEETNIMRIALLNHFDSARSACIQAIANAEKDFYSEETMLENFKLGEEQFYEDGAFAT
jgi:hypothetical protein